MLAFAFLLIGVACAVVSRVLLFVAAFRISLAWGLGVLLPFGPFLFRVKYPEEAHASRMFRFATLPCFFVFIVLGPGPAYQRHLFKATHLSLLPGGYKMEKKKADAPTEAEAAPTPSLAERRVSNTHEFEHLRAWAEALRLKKRDLLHSDTDGNIAYAAELSQYNAALDKAKAERTQLWPAAR